jgi:hypothetical protein
LKLAYVLVAPRTLRVVYDSETESRWWHTPTVVGLVEPSYKAFLFDYRTRDRIRERLYDRARRRLSDVLCETLAHRLGETIGRFLGRLEGELTFKAKL